MSTQKQIFQTSSRIRWNTFRWLSRFFILALVLMVPIVWIALARVTKPALPTIDPSIYKKIQPATPKKFTTSETKKYKGFDDFLAVKQKNASLIKAEKNKKVTDRVRAGFYVDWDPQSFYSLQSHIRKMNMVIPEWFFIDPITDTLKPQIDTAAYNLMKKYPVKILPILNNVNVKSGDGDFDGAMLDRIFQSKEKTQRLISSILNYLDKYKLQGINIDFEEIKESSIEPMHAFQRKLYAALHSKGYLVTQDIMPADEDYHVKELAACNDYVFIMAYDQHWGSSVPGPICDQKWIEKTVDEVAKDVPSEKIVLAIAAFGYDWPQNGEATSVTYQEALSTAREFNGVIDFDNDTYNCSYNYTASDKRKHSVYFTDAASSFNTIRFADQYGTAGVALWRLGSEDERLWRFYSHDLSNDSLAVQPFDFSVLQKSEMIAEKPDYIGEGEILDVKAEPQKGVIDLEINNNENTISEENYKQLPTRFVIKKTGKVNNQVLLTFDDGPDPDYTPRILDILEKEKVPAAFFIVGVNAENNLPILKRIYHEGFEIGNHSFTHPNMAEVSNRRAETEMEATRLLIEAATGRSTVLFRAPYNADSEPTKLVELRPVARGKADHYYTVGESIDPEDWDTQSGVNADSIYNRVIRQYEQNPQKGIILLHDAGGNREATVQALPRIIYYFKTKGVKFATVADILHLPKDSIMPAVNDEVVKLNGWVSTFLYWTGHFLYAVFWVAIVAGFLRIAFIGALAILQYYKTKRAKVIPAIFNEPVSIIVPAYNEEINAVKTIRNLLQQDYPSVEIIFVDDGSKDNTYQNVRDAFQDHPKVTVLTKPNGGKASALNVGINHSKNAFVVCIDADTQLLPDAVSRMMPFFADEKTAAVAGNVKVGNDKSILTKWQAIEYTTAQNFDRLAFDLINGITVVPGAIGAFRKAVIQEVGGFATDTLAEDCDLTIRILRNGYTVRNCTEAIAITEAPETVNQFMKQRFRWSYGIMQSFWKNKDAFLNPRYKTLGMVALPNILLFQILLPLFGPLADMFFFAGLYMNRNNAASEQKLLLFYGLFLLVDVAVSAMAFAFGKEKWHRVFWLIPQRFVYRVLMYIVLFRSIRKAIKGEGQGWGILKRTGNVAELAVPLQSNPQISTTK